jgi:hypothetical protein
MNDILQHNNHILNSLDVLERLLELGADDAIIKRQVETIKKRAERL